MRILNKNKKKKTLRRLNSNSKTLDANFLQEIQHGLNCSPFEAEAVLEVVRELHFFFWMNNPSRPRPARRP